MFTPFGVVILGTGILFFLWSGRNLLSRESTRKAHRSRRTTSDFVAAYGLLNVPLAGQVSWTVFYQAVGIAEIILPP